MRFTSRHFPGVLAALLLAAGGTPARADAHGSAGASEPAPGGPLQVLTTIPDLVDIVQRIGGERVQARSIADGTENIHGVQIRPSSMVAAHRAQVFVQVGLSLEHAWVPGLLEAVRNPRIQPGAPSFVTVSAGWQPINVPQSASRQAGADIHLQGNPHINLSQRGGRHMAGQVLEALVRIDPEGRALFERRFAEYARELERAEQRWAQLRGELAGGKVVSYHRSFDYLIEDLGLEQVGTVEPKPGVPPSPRHTAALIELMRGQDSTPVILTAPWSNGSVVREIARRSGARVVEIPDMVGGAKDSGTWIGMMDLVHGRLREAFARDPAPGPR
jgi:zinc/manganese transport system substrate-binding protein